jgi:predicted dehydrogenase
METTTRICLVGTGWTAANHRNGYQAIPEKARVAAVVAHSDASRAKADAWEVPRVYRAIEEALADPDLDLIDICTPHYHHAEMAFAALEAGKHVLVETPTCTSAEECRRLRLALFGHPRQKAATGHICRSWRTFAQARDLAQSGRIGALIHLSSAYVHHVDPEEYPSMRTWGRSPRAQLRLGIQYHPLDLLRWIAGDVEEVSGEFSDHARIALLRFRNGALGQVFQTGASTQPYSLPLSVSGTAGAIDCWWEEEVLRGRLHSSTAWQPEPLESMPLHGRGSPEWRYEMEDLVDSIREDRDPVCPMLEGIKTIETCLAVEAAMTCGGKVRVVHG